jgi:hypothetical protein
MVLGLLMFILALGSIVFHSAQMREELARERYTYRKTMNILESMTTAACAACSSVWRTHITNHPEATDIGTYIITVEGIQHDLAVAVEKGDFILVASCKGKHGEIIALKTHLGFEGERAVIHEQKRI